MKTIIGLFLVALMIIPSGVMADTPQLGYKILPGKIIENTDGIIEVYPKTGGVPIDNLTVTSSDSNIVKILETVEDAQHFMLKVKIHAVNQGIAKVAIAAPGFTSEDFDLKVYKNSNLPTKLLIKTGPSTFATNAPKSGFVGVETVNDDGIPIAVNSDLPVSITTSDSNVVIPIDSQIIIKSGTYYAVGKFSAGRAGTAQVSASSPQTQSVSTTVTVNSVSTQNTIQAYVFPSKINAFNAATAYVIAQLHDSSGNPTPAKEDVAVTLQISNGSGIGSVNTSGQNLLFQSNQKLTIHKGSYWAVAPIGVAAGLSGQYGVQVSAKGYVVGTPAVMTCDTSNALLDTKSAKLDIVPVMATGKSELIGVLHLEDPSGKVLLARENINVHIDSSDPSLLNIPDVQMSRASQAALVYGQVGSVANPVSLSVVTDIPQSVTPTITIPNVDTTYLGADSLVPKALTHSDFPMVFYKRLADNSLAKNTGSFSFLISPADVVQTGSIAMTSGIDVTVGNGTLLKDGTQNISVSSPTYSATFSVEGVTAGGIKSASLDYPDNMVSGVSSTFSVELLDSLQNPTYTNKDINLKVISSNTGVIDFPSSVTIKAGTYFTSFDVSAKGEGTSEISVLANEVPLSKFTATVTSLVPQFTISSADFGETGLAINAQATASYNGMPLKGASVQWQISGATIQSSDPITDDNGNAKVTFITSTPGALNIVATIGGGQYKTTTVTKTMTINPPASGQQAPANTQPQTQGTQQPAPSGTNIMQSGLLMIIIIVAIAGGAGAFVFLKREMIMEKISEMRDSD